MSDMIGLLRKRADACFSRTTGSAPLDYLAADEMERLIADREFWEKNWANKCDRLTAENVRLRGLVRAVASETSIPMEEIEQSIDAAAVADGDL